MTIYHSTDRVTVAMLDRLRAVQATCGLGGGDRTAMLVRACINEGICLGGQIVAVLTSLDAGHGHIRQLLRLGIGIAWTRNADRTLALLN